MITIWGPAATPDGTAYWDNVPFLDERGVAHRGEGRVGRLPGTNFRPHQPHEIPVTWGHRRHLGQVRYLEQSHDGALHAVATLAAVPPEVVTGPCYFSTSTRATPRGGIEHDAVLDEIGLCERSASIGLAPLRYAVGDLAQVVGSGHPVPPIVRRAAEAARRYWRWNAPTLIVPEPRHAVTLDPDDWGRMAGPISFSAPYAGIISVR